MRGAIVLIVVLAVMYFYTQSAKKQEQVSTSAELPPPKEVKATSGSNDTLGTIIRDIANIMDDVREVVDGATDRNAA